MLYKTDLTVVDQTEQTNYKLYLPFTSRIRNSIKSVAQRMFITMVTYRAEVKICTLGAFPADTKYGMFTTSIAHNRSMFYTFKEMLKHDFEAAKYMQSPGEDD